MSTLNNYTKQYVLQHTPISALFPALCCVLSVQTIKLSSKRLNAKFGAVLRLLLGFIVFAFFVYCGGNNCGIGQGFIILDSFTLGYGFGIA